MTNKNAREQLYDVAVWLSYQEEDMSFGLKSPEDGLKLWRYAEEHPKLDEMADTWDAKDRIDALGYDPLEGVY